MEDAHYFFALAGVGVCLAGSASVVATVSRPKSRSQAAVETFRIRGVLESSLIIVVLSLLPLGLVQILEHEEAAWRFSSVAFLILATAVAVAVYGRARVLAPLLKSRTTRVLLTILYVSPLPFLLVGVFGAFENRLSDVYLACVLSHLLAAILGFYKAIVSIITAD